MYFASFTPARCLELGAGVMPSLEPGSKTVLLLLCDRAAGENDKKGPLVSPPYDSITESEF